MAHIFQFQTFLEFIEPFSNTRWRTFRFVVDIKLIFLHKHQYASQQLTVKCN
jgi:hypothetical protein